VHYACVERAQAAMRGPEPGDGRGDDVDVVPAGAGSREVSRRGDAVAEVVSVKLGGGDEQVGALGLDAADGVVGLRLASHQPRLRVGGAHVDRELDAQAG
jgi:hypothetical protein